MATDLSNGRAQPDSACYKRLEALAIDHFEITLMYWSSTLKSEYIWGLYSTNYTLARAILLATFRNLSGFSHERGFEMSETHDD